VSEKLAPAVHFHFGPRRSGVGVFIDKVFTDEKLGWRTIHLSGDAFSLTGRYHQFLSGIFELSRRKERVIFAHTLKAGIAAAVVKAMRPTRTFIYVGHGIRYFQKPHSIWSARYLIAEVFVCFWADRIVHIRKLDVINAKAVLPTFLHAKIIHIAPKLSDPDVEAL
jgi:hypothetical protein